MKKSISAVISSIELFTQLDPTRERACYLAKTTSRQIGRFKILFSLDAKLACHVTNIGILSSTDERGRNRYR